MLPSIFVSHGAPTLPFDPVPARDFLAGLGQTLGRPRAIVVASAHWDNHDAAVTGAARNATIHDFYGFPRRLYDIRYSAPGDPELARKLRDLLGADMDDTRGLDHGAWVPLMLMYPDADIPVVQIAVQSDKGVAHHIALGRRLAQLRDDGVLVTGSGGFVHNLGKIAPPGSPEPDWSQAFSQWVHERLMASDEAALVDYRVLAPHAALAHPTEEHFMPLFVALGAGGTPRRLHSSSTFGSLRMDAYAFG